MKKIAFFGAKSYDREAFDAANNGRYEIRYFRTRLAATSVPLAEECDAVCAFVNDTIDKEVIERLIAKGVKVIAMRCAGYNNVDIETAFDTGMTVVRVPAYSPYAVAEHAAALLLSLNRHIHKAAARTRDYNFSLSGLTGFDLHGKTAGIIGAGKIGRIFADIMKGFGMKVLAYDAFPNPNSGLEYCELDRIFSECDVISLHCPLTPDSHHLINRENLRKMKPNAILINTSRGGLIDSEALLHALRRGYIGGAGLDVYEEEGDWFYDDHSDAVSQNKVLSLLVGMPNVIITSHQAFLTREALNNIANTTLDNLDAFFGDKPLENEICYCCHDGKTIMPANCAKRLTGRCDHKRC